MQECIEKKDQLIALIGQEDEVLSLYEWGGQCGDLTHAQLVAIINGVIEGLIHIREEGNQNDYHRAGQQINNVIYPYVFEQYLGILLQGTKQEEKEQIKESHGERAEANKIAKQ